MLFKIQKMSSTIKKCSSHVHVSFFKQFLSSAQPRLQLNVNLPDEILRGFGPCSNKTKPNPYEPIKILYATNKFDYNLDSIDLGLYTFSPDVQATSRKHQSSTNISILYDHK